MALSDITLSGGMRSDLVQLQLVSALQSRTTERLATGKRVNSATDDPAAYFAAQDHLSHASDLSARKADMGEALKSITAANTGITGITSLIEQAKGLVTSARSQNTAGRATLATQFTALRTQIDQLAADSGYKGKNFLASDTLDVAFNETGTSTLTITGFDGSTTGLAIADATNAWVGNADLDTATTDLNAALTTLRANASTLSSNNSVISSRQDFVTGMINNLNAGANDLTAADPNEESANMLALSTRQQLGVATLGLANQAQQSILRLF
jgi:flagellin